MQPHSLVSYDWIAPTPVSRYRTGVSLHSHTSYSVESLTFIHKMFAEHPALRGVMAYYERVSREKHGITLDFEQAHWRPPLVPQMAYDVESRQIRELGLRPLVSLTDHDEVEAPMLLSTMRPGLPISTEWTVPFGDTIFHMGIHNLPRSTAAHWLQRFKAYTASPSEDVLRSMLDELHSHPEILIVLNHPLWDLYDTKELHRSELERFLREHGTYVHALELNGLRHPKENREVEALARQWSQLLISGGDRHGMEPNANINLTHARTFADFVHEIRVERRSHVLFLQQYRQPWARRLMASTLDAVTDQPGFSIGWQRWDERAFHSDTAGVVRPLSELWPAGRAPLALRLAINIVRLTRHRTVAGALHMLLPRIDTGVAGALDTLSDQ